MQIPAASNMHWLLMVIAVMLGVIMPEYYDWSGEDQSRPAAITRWLALGIVAANLAVYSWLGWLHYRRPEPQTNSNQPHRFSIAQLMIVTAVIAAIAAGQNLLHVSLARAATFALIGYALWLVVRRPTLRLPVLTLLVCMWGPMLWLMRWPEMRNNIPIVAAIVLLFDLPALLLALWISLLMGWNFSGDSSISAYCAAVELALGLWMIQQGPKRGLAYTMAALTLAIFSSFAIHALMRA